MYLYPNNQDVNSYSLVTVQKDYSEMFKLNVLDNHNGSVCAQSLVTKDQLSVLLPFKYSSRVYVDNGYQTRSGTVVGEYKDYYLVHYEQKPCRDYARLEKNILPLTN